MEDRNQTARDAAMLQYLEYEMASLGFTEQDINDICEAAMDAKKRNIEARNAIRKEADLPRTDGSPVGTLILAGVLKAFEIRDNES